MYNIGIPMDLPTPLDPPPCWNRPPMAEGQWQVTGRYSDLTYAAVAAPPVYGMIDINMRKPIWRWRPNPFTDRCATHDGQGIGPNGESYPEAHGWMPWCRLCRWFETSSAAP